MTAHLVYEGLALLSIDALQAQLCGDIEGFQDGLGRRVDVELRQQIKTLGSQRTTGRWLITRLTNLS